MNLNKALSNRFVPEADGRAHSLAEHTVCTNDAAAKGPNGRYCSVALKRGDLFAFYPPNRLNS